MQGRQVRKVGWGPRKTCGLPLSVLVDRPKQGTGTKARMPRVGRSAESWGARQPAHMSSSSNLLLLPDRCLGAGVVSWCFLNMCRIGSSLFLTPSD